MNKALRLVKSFLPLLNRKQMGVFTRISELTKFDYDFNVSWSQGGEDLALISILRDIHRGKYIDVGAHHPSRFSVTRHLYQQGWSGINVEANASLISLFKEKRPRDTSIARFVGSPSKRIFHIFSEPALSTSSSAIRDLLVEQSRTLISSTEVEPISLREIYDTYMPDQTLDLLTIDAEGSDLDVLESLDFHTLGKDRWPRFVLVETAPPVDSALSFESVVFLKSLGYTPQVVLSMATILAAPKAY
jgi:FkbM family methyltransferase